MWLILPFWGGRSEKEGDNGKEKGDNDKALKK
jgi:hypothetical protein